MIKSTDRFIASKIIVSETALAVNSFAPPVDFVISANKDGTPLSKYADDFWDLTPYDADGEPSILSFQFWKEGVVHEKRSALVAEVKWIMYLPIYQRPGRAISNGSIRNYCKPLNSFARFCEIRGTRIQDLLASPPILMECLAEKDQLTKLSASLLNFLTKLGPKVVGYDVVNKKEIAALQRRAAKWVDQNKQHPPIPTRIYSEVLSGLTRELTEFEGVADNLLQVLEQCLADPLMGRGPENQWKKRNQLGWPRVKVQPGFQQLLQQYGLEQFWAARGYSKDLRGLSSSVLEMTIAASLQIQAYTGMRANEVAALPFDCLEEVLRPEDGSIHYLVAGRVRKLEGGRAKRARWVTSEKGCAAVRLAQRVAQVIFRATTLGIAWENSTVTPEYLFLSAGLLGAKKSGKIADLKSYRHKTFQERLPLISEDDLLELERIDPHRAWRFEEKFKVGARWHFTSHQLRRSLALYAQRSGLVSLPSLKRQLHHITSEMSSYYARGSAFASQFVVSDYKEKHFGLEWQQAQPISQYLSYAIHVLFGDETELVGAHPHWIKHRLKNEKGVVMLDRAATLRRFQKGELMYRETLLGGCVKVGDCDKNPLDFLHVECITTHCKNMVGQKRRLERVVVAQRQLVETLAAQDISSPEHRHESANLLALQSALAKQRI